MDGADVVKAGSHLTTAKHGGDSVDSGHEDEITNEKGSTNRCTR